MQIIDLKTLDGKLVACIRAVEQGETVQITEEGRIVAEIVPAPRDRTSATEQTTAQAAVEAPMTAEQRWAELIRQGIVTPAEKPLTGPPPHFPIMSLEELMKEIEEDRADR